MGSQRTVREANDLMFTTHNRKHETQVIELEKVYSAIRPMFVILYRTGDLAKVGALATVVSPLRDK